MLWWANNNLISEEKYLSTQNTEEKSSAILDTEHINFCKVNIIIFPHSVTWIALLNLSQNLSCLFALTKLFSTITKFIS